MVPAAYLGPPSGEDLPPHPSLRMPGQTTDLFAFTRTGPDDFTATGDLGGSDGIVDLNLTTIP